MPKKLELANWSPVLIEVNLNFEDFTNKNSRIFIKQIPSHRKNIFVKNFCQILSFILNFHNFVDNLEYWLSFLDFFLFFRHNSYELNRDSTETFVDSVFRNCFNL